MSLPAAELALPDARAARRAFDRASSSFDRARFVHDEARRRLLERLQFVRIAPQVVVDVGCATGLAALELASRYPLARVLAVDPSRGMLREARALSAASPAVTVLGGTAERLPLREASADLLIANLSLPWCEPGATFREFARLLGDGGLAMFATLGPDSLQEVRRAWSTVDDRVHVHAFFDMHDLGDLAVAAGLAEPVMDVDRIEVTYADARALVRDLRACGAINVAGGRRSGLTGPRRWQRFERALHTPEGRFAVTVELVLGQAWGTGLSRSAGDGTGREFGVPVGRIGRRSKRS
jgi:malonyl-CoA O-methyltransferase